ncbi:hypothetical protein ACSP9A_002188 [Acinetobacter baumannii]|nr:hypothetical protein [Acinetobacter baumannii]
MEKNPIFLYLPIIISLATFAVAYAQMKIASAKTKLDLYNKRFNIYSLTLELYQAFYFKTFDEMNIKIIEFTKAYRESLFLFDKEDGIYDVLSLIQQSASEILSYEKLKYESDVNTSIISQDLSYKHEIALKALQNYEIHLISLEIKISKYIQFKTKSGWHLF